VEANNPQPQELLEELPEDPFEIITIRWKEDGIPIIDLRGVNCYTAHSILLSAAEQVGEALGDMMIFFSDDDVMEDSEIEEFMESDEPEED
jgi:hypothetical protein